MDLTLCDKVGGQDDFDQLLVLDLQLVERFDFFARPVDRSHIFSFLCIGVLLVVPRENGAKLELALAAGELLDLDCGVGCDCCMTCRTPR